MPLSVGIGLITSVATPPAPGWPTVLSAMESGNPVRAAGSFIRSWTGIYGIDGTEPFGINLMDALNPLSFNDAPAWKATLWSSIIMKLVKKFGKTDPLERIPVVNKLVKFA